MIRNYEDAVSIVNTQSPASSPEKREELAGMLMAVAIKYDVSLEKAWEMDWDLLNGGVYYEPKE